MNELSFRPDVLPLKYIKEHGVLYSEDIFYCDDYESGALFDKDPKFGGKPFTGLLYELDSNGNLRYYKYYTEGFDDGEYVAFYDSGAIASYCVMKNAAFVGKLYKWHRNGKIKSFKEIDENRKHIRTVRFDDAGNIIFLMEKGKIIIDKGKSI
ncbi:MAG: hypothetical protein K5875_02700 [Saccharofermentans sp.]|nr:hypothetical protein [Saccharofermentans sp.]